jgi:hypothetical protein
MWHQLDDAACRIVLPQMIGSHLGHDIGAPPWTEYPAPLTDVALSMVVS